MLQVPSVGPGIGPSAWMGKTEMLRERGVDYAETETGEWKALEAGDGQVSGLSDYQDAEAYYRALYHAFTA